MTEPIPDILTGLPEIKIGQVYGLSGLTSVYPEHTFVGFYLENSPWLTFTGGVSVPGDGLDVPTVTPSTYGRTYHQVQ